MLREWENLFVGRQMDFLLQSHSWLTSMVIWLPSSDVTIHRISTALFSLSLLLLLARRIIALTRENHERTRCSCSQHNSYYECQTWCRLKFVSNLILTTQLDSRVGKIFTVNRLINYTTVTVPLQTNHCLWNTLELSEQDHHIESLEGEIIPAVNWDLQFIQLEAICTHLSSPHSCTSQFSLSHRPDQNFLSTFCNRVWGLFFAPEKCNLLIVDASTDIIEWIRRVISRDLLVGDHLEKLQKMDASVHIFYQLANISGIFAAGLGNNASFLLRPILLITVWAAAIVWFVTSVLLSLSVLIDIFKMPSLHGTLSVRCTESLSSLVNFILLSTSEQSPRCLSSASIVSRITRVLSEQHFSPVTVNLRFHLLWMTTWHQW